MFHPASLLHECVDIVRRSGDIVREHWERPPDVRHKGRIDLVTRTDLAVEAFLKEKLGALLPEAAFLAEESSQEADEPQGLCWIIDPVDGTTNFVHHIPLVGTSVALWAGGRVELGVVNVPLMGECYSAARGMGAHCNGLPLAVSTAAALENALVGTGFPYDFTGKLARILERLQRVLPRAQGVRRMGAASVDLAYVACGRLDIFYEEGLKSWDFAAGVLLVEEAGGTVSNLDGNPVRFGETLLATNGQLHAEALALLAPTRCMQKCLDGHAQ